ncbi:MAG: hypothetical protein CL764_02790 [Chloroflexi bacterium]|nr:hypothetical protein [Chloroflexota bacterium]|tara:strand:- start:15991 stop:16341 length:351 start_codon:yes stop_codon:yes gene_type:complete
MTINIRIMYWKEIPLQVEGVEGSNRNSFTLDSRFQEAADAIAMFDGSYGSDAYLDGFQWKEHGTFEGDLDTVVNLKLKEINERMPENFVSILRDLIKKNKRNPSPGSIDYLWNENG